MSNELREFQDRLALRQLVEAYASGCDRRESAVVAGCFTEDGRLALYDAAGQLTRETKGRAAIETAIENLRRFDMTTHFLGQQSVRLDGETASGETYCLAHHIYRTDDGPYNRVMSIRYLDTYLRQGAGWRFEDRSLMVDWVEHRPLGAPPPPDTPAR